MSALRTLKPGPHSCRGNAVGDFFRKMPETLAEGRLHTVVCRHPVSANGFEAWLKKNHYAYVRPDNGNIFHIDTRIRAFFAKTRETIVGLAAGESVEITLPTYIDARGFAAWVRRNGWYFGTNGTTFRVKRDILR